MYLFARHYILACLSHCGEKNVETTEKFAANIAEWIEKNCPESMRTPMGHDDVFWGGRNPEFQTPDTKLWFEAMRDKGYLAPTWSQEFGGAGLSVDEAKILQQQLLKFGCRPALMSLAIHMMGPTIQKYGTKEQQQQHLPAIARGEIRWCQGYSEPNAGSDLASLRCKAEVAEGGFVVTGQKVWTSHADQCDYMFCLVRTDFDVPKHQGISILLIDMASAGITVKPIELISGSSHFCEVYLDQVFVPQANLLGELNKGWSIAKFMLQCERDMMGQQDMPFNGTKLLGSWLSHVEDPQMAKVVRGEVAKNDIQMRAIALTADKVQQHSKIGEFDMAAVGLKYAMSENYIARMELMLELFGSAGLGWNDTDNFSTEELFCSHEWAFAKIQSIGGGTSEVQLNIIAKQILGLPE